MKKVPALLIALTLCSALGGCGQKGPLYLPQPQQPAPDTAPKKATSGNP